MSTIYTKAGDKIEWFSRNSSDFVDKTTLLFGGSGSGKTTIIEEILYKCKDHIPNYLAIVPATSDEVYRNKLPGNCILENLTKKKLEDIWDRQVSASQIYKLVNDKESKNLKSLFDKTRPCNEHHMINNIIQRRNEIINRLEQDNSKTYAERKCKINKIKSICNTKLQTVYKNTIRKQSIYLKSPSMSNKLTINENIVLEYLDFNPRLMIIIDDNTENFKTWMKMFPKESNTFEQIFYKGRHNYITLVFAAHDDAAVKPGLRKNARTTIFTSGSLFISSLSKVTNGYSKEEKKVGQRVAGPIFSSSEGEKTYKKLCYINDSEFPFKYFVADMYPDFKLGSAGLWKLSSKIPSNQPSLVENPFLSDTFRKKYKSSSVAVKKITPITRKRSRY